MRIMGIVEGGGVVDGPAHPTIGTNPGNLKIRQGTSKERPMLETQGIGHKCESESYSEVGNRTSVVGVGGTINKGTDAQLRGPCAMGVERRDTGCVVAERGSVRNRETAGRL